MTVPSRPCCIDCRWASPATDRRRTSPTSPQPVLVRRRHAPHLLPHRRRRTHSANHRAQPARLLQYGRDRSACSRPTPPSNSAPSTPASSSSAGRAWSRTRREQRHGLQASARQVLSRPAAGRTTIGRSSKRNCGGLRSTPSRSTRGAENRNPHRSPKRTRQRDDHRCPSAAGRFRRARRACCTGSASRSRPVRLPEQLEGLAGLIMPGGESTTIGKLATTFGLMDPLRALRRPSTPCGGRAPAPSSFRSDAGRDQPLLDLMDITVERNAFGRQVDSFETDLAPADARQRPSRRSTAVFIRAPLIESVGAGVEILARLADPAAPGWRADRRRPPGEACWPPPSIPSSPATTASTPTSSRWPGARAPHDPPLRLARPAPAASGAPAWPVPRCRSWPTPAGRTCCSMHCSTCSTPVAWLTRWSCGRGARLPSGRCCSRRAATAPTSPSSARPRCSRTRTAWSCWRPWRGRPASTAHTA